VEKIIVTRGQMCLLNLFAMQKIKGKCVMTLTLGLRPKQGLAKAQAKSETQESHFMLLGV
jgi:hypothetical protein